MDFEEYLTSPPNLHSWDGGKTWNTGGFSGPDLRRLREFIDSELGPQPRILETGAGNSTLTFLFLQPGRLVSIAPDGALFERIRSYCRDHGVDDSPLSAHVACSQWVLPKLADVTLENDLFDFVLIDGNHNWPLVFVDFFYCNYLLRTGGLLMIDDMQLHSVKELGRMLFEQPGYEVALDMGKSLVFRRTGDHRQFGDWVSVPYIYRKSMEYGQSENPFAT